MTRPLLLLSFLLLTGMGALAQVPDTLRTFADTIRYFKSTAKPIEELNSPAIEYAPSISADGKTMIIESNKTGRYELYDSKLVNGTWTDPVSIDAINNYGDSSDLIAGPSISFDGNTLYFFASFLDGLGSEDIYYSERTKDGWSAPKNIGAPINSRGYEGFPSISSDGNTMYFVRQNYVGPSNDELAKEWANKACFSIYVSRKQKNGTWGEPEPLPYPINVDCEKAPRIMADNRTLIFASNRPGGFGDYDLYQSRLNDVGDWTAPVSMEYVNTPSSDQFSSITAQGDILYYVYDSKDIYSVEIPHKYRQFKNVIIQGYIKDGETGEGVGTELIVSDAYTSGELMRIRNNPEDGRYTVVLAVGSNYNLEIKTEGYTSKSFFYDLSEEDEYKEIDQDITLYKSAKLNLNIYDSDLFEPVMANIKVKELNGSAPMIDIENTESGRITLDLPLGKKYEVTIDKPNFDAKQFMLDVSGLVVYPDFIRDIDMVPHKRRVKLNVADLVNNSKVRSRVRIRNRNRDEVIEVNGNETVALRVGDRYEIEATSDQGYAFKTAVIDVVPEGQEQIIDPNSTENIIAIFASEDGEAVMPDIDMKLQPLLTGTNLTLKDILFESNSDQLNEISFVELERVVELMKHNDGLKVEIAAYTDDIGSAEYNASLSDRRAQSVARYLKENKISDDRFVSRGYGESQPIFPNDSEENRAKNRRVVLKILAI
ncbi:OmpA family protein [Marinoscillum sp. MHG1-6]|uniref:OmpA family protein n=1 Tax=Marinoscillum sp. MHG1-6 TaxID=2959627 RepID=UPI0021585F9A|nr:OmpA family protein [Marinoscillum sp. MHG1-6]